MLWSLEHAYVADSRFYTENFTRLTHISFVFDDLSTLVGLIIKTKLTVLYI